MGDLFPIVASHDYKGTAAWLALNYTQCSWTAKGHQCLSASRQLWYDWHISGGTSWQPQQN